MAWLTATDALWRTLRRPWLLVVIGSGVALVLLSARLLPQLPSQLSGDPTASARWLAGASAEYGGLGEILRGLGLFNASHSLLLQWLLGVMALILLVLFGDAVATALHYRRMIALVAMPASGDAEPLTAPTAHTLYRQREAVAQPPDALAEQLRLHLNARFDHVTMNSVPLTEVASVVEDASGPALEATPDNVEHRVMALRNRRGVMLQPALWVAALLAVVVAWRIVIIGWDVTSPALAPGDEYRSSARGLSFLYVVGGVDEHEPATQLLAQVGGQEVALPIAAYVAQSVAGVDVVARAALPGLYIATEDGELALARAGQTETVAGLGLAFPGPGSEESVILPQAGVGLRLVRMADDIAPGAGAFMLEVYEGESAQPTRRVTLGSEPATTIAVNDDGLTLRFIQLPALVVSARHLPGLWLLWGSLLLAVVGAVGFWRRPAYLLAQIAPWPTGRALLIAQSDARTEIADLPLAAPLPPPAEGS